MEKTKIIIDRIADKIRALEDFNDDGLDDDTLSGYIRGLSEAITIINAASLTPDDDPDSDTKLRTRSRANQSMNPTSNAQAGEASRDDGYDAGENTQSDV